MMQKVKMPVGNHLFKFEDSCAKLCDRNKVIFHQLVAKILFLIKRAQPYIHPTITFLTTRVKNMDEDNWKKLQRVLRYLDATIHIVKIHLNANDLNVFHWWVDASYGTHPYLKGQTGVTVSIGKGCLTSTFKKI